MMKPAILAAALVFGLSASAFADEGTPAPPALSWSFHGPFGKFDRGQLQRGFKVYREVCANCHGLKYVAFRNLAEPGGPEFSEAQVRALAAEYKIQDGPNDAGDMFERRAVRRTASRRLSRRQCRRRRERRQGAAGPVADAAGAHLRARLPPLHHRRLHPVRRERRRLPGRPAHRLRGAAEGFSGSARRQLQPLLSWPRHRDAEAPQRRAGRVSEGAGRPAAGAGDGRAICARRHRVPVLDGGPASRGAQAHRLPGHHLPPDLRRADVLHQEAVWRACFTRNLANDLDAGPRIGALRFSCPART